MISLQQLQTDREMDRFWDLEVESGPDSGDPTEVNAHPHASREPELLWAELLLRGPISPRGQLIA